MKSKTQNGLTLHFISSWLITLDKESGSADHGKLSGKREIAVRSFVTLMHHDRKAAQNNTLGQSDRSGKPDIYRMAREGFDKKLQAVTLQASM